MLGPNTKPAIVTIALATAIVFTPLAWADPPGTNPDPTSMPSLHETRLAVQARNALGADPILAPFINSSQIGVRVRQNVATLYGNVPTKEIAEKAVDCLRNMQKLQILADVRSELEIVTPTIDPRLFKGQVEQKSKTPVAPSVPKGELASRENKDKATPARKALSTSPHVDLKGPAGLRIGDDSPTETVLQKETVKLLPPVSLDLDVKDNGPAQLLRPKALPPQRSLYSQVEDLRKKDDRYSGIRIRVDGAVVYLSPSDAESLFDFAEAVSRIDGVSRVVIEK
jgi:hypothetical protein